MTRPVLFLSDFGLDDEYVGVCHAVIARLAPDVRVIDLTHGVPAQDVLAGAMALARAVPYAPENAVYLAVVDPGVGTERRGVGVEAGDAVLVGPDNGVLALAAAALGGARRAVELDAVRLSPWPVSETFHGRDVFAPAAARLASGAELGELGAPIEAGDLTELVGEAPMVEPGRIAATVVGVDRFGNVHLGAGPSELKASGLDGEPALALLGPSGGVALRRVRTFGELDRGELGLLVDSAGRLALVANLASAAELLGLRRNDRAVLGRPETR